MASPAELPPLEPRLQVSFYYRLFAVRAKYLLDGLRMTVSELDVASLDSELSRCVPPAALRRTASFGFRGELFFPIPTLLQRNPLLLGYYRLLFGFSRKEFYSRGPFGRFRCMEESGDCPERIAGMLHALCRSLITTAAAMVEKLDNLSLQTVHELQLLTLGPQWRGEENTRIGQRATQDVYQLTRSIVEPFILSATRKTIDLRNAAGRMVAIEFGSDPDVTIVEALEGRARPVVSIEIKGGADASNIHNRLGEAEKSHQKAKRLGFLEFWTIVRVGVPDDVVKSESPTTTRCFLLDELLDPSSAEHRDFLREFTSRLGVETRRTARYRDGA